MDPTLEAAEVWKGTKVVEKQMKGEWQLCFDNLLYIDYHWKYATGDIS